MARRTFEEVTEVLETDEGLNLRDYIHFHLFNPNGAAADWKAACQEVDDAVDRGDLLNGALFAYGSLNSFAYDELVRLCGLRRRERIRTVVAVKMLRDAAKKAREKARGG